MLERILVPMDGTSLADQALIPALSIARAAGAEVHLATVVISLPVGLPELPYEASVGQVQADYLDAVARRVEEAGVQIGSAAVVRGDDIVPALEAHRTECGATLTVMSSHGRGPVARAWLGSVADRFVRTTEAPVLLVRASPGDGKKQDLTADVPFRRVLVPLDGSTLSEAALEPEAELVGAIDAEYVLVRVVEPPHPLGSSWLVDSVAVTEEQLRAARALADAELEGAARRFRATGHSVEQVAEVGTLVAVGILDIADSREVDLIAMATHGRGGLRRLVLGGVTDKVVRGADCPVLVVRPRDRP